MSDIITWIFQFQFRACYYLLDINFTVLLLYLHGKLFREMSDNSRTMSLKRW